MAGKVGGGGSDKYTISQNADINVTPFVDIMLVLLIIFMCSIPPPVVSIKLDMPPATPPRATDKPKKPVYISIQEGGDLYIVDTKTSIETLANDVRQAVTSNDPSITDPRQEIIFIRADSEVQYERFMDVLNELEKKGFFKVGLINEDIS
jgi:biopolymer transport protein ExbD